MYTQHHEPGADYLIKNTKKRKNGTVAEMASAKERIVN